MGDRLIANELDEATGYFGGGGVGDGGVYILALGYGTLGN